MRPGNRMDLIMHAAAVIGSYSTSDLCVKIRSFDYIKPLTVRTTRYLVLRELRRRNVWVVTEFKR